MKLLLFDVDLTLIDTAGAGRRAMTQAFQRLFGFENGLAEVSFAGRTDPAIFRDAITQQGLEWQKEKEDAFKKTYLDSLAVEIDKPNSRRHIEPGVSELLQRLINRDDVCLGLLTGNWQGGARIKLCHFDLYQFFEFGAFGDDSENRNDLPAHAVERFLERQGQRINPADVFVIGDTPLDVACAKSFGAQSVAVATGFFSFADLQDSHPDFLFPDLSNLTSFLRILES